jgi:hypothetical protein
MDGGQCTAKIYSDTNRFLRAESAMVPNELCERPTTDELGPDPYSAIDALRTVDREHVGMANASQEAPLFNERGGGVSRSI